MSALKTIIKLVKGGECAIVFPEGERTLDGKMGPAQPGLGLVIAKTLAPVVPMRIFGAYEAFPRGGKGLRPGRSGSWWGSRWYLPRRTSRGADGIYTSG